MTAPSNQHNNPQSRAGIAAGTLTLATHAQALQVALTDLSTLTVQQLVALFRELGTQKDFPILLKTAFSQIITSHTQAAAQITAQWYDDLITAEMPSTPVVDIPADRIAKTVDWALYAPSEDRTEAQQRVHADENISAQSVAPEQSLLTKKGQPSQETTLSRLSGSAQRMVFDASRTTVIVNSTDQTRYARYASANACEFCRLLATRSDEYLYRTAKSAVRVVGIGRGDRIRGTRAVGEKFHDHCRCIAVPIPAGQSWEAPGYVGDWQQQYQAAREALGKYPTTKDILSQMRRIAKEK